MKNLEYFRLFKDEQFVGFKRIITEYLPAGHNAWQLDQVEHDETQRLSRPAIGIETLKRKRIISGRLNKMSRYILTTEHAASSYEQPVLVDTETNIAYGLADILPDGTPAVQLYEQLSRCEEPPESQQ